LFGGLGVKSGEMVERLYREIRALRIYEGATEVQKIIIARESMRDTLKSPLEAGDAPPHPNLPKI
jgi:acyl-CoA dehydrogenase